MTKVAKKSAMHGESGYARVENDAYWTPEWCVDVLLRHVSWTSSYNRPTWEPACGAGNICKVLVRNNYDVYASDLYDHGFGISGVDFLKQYVPTPNSRYSAIITNPPYSHADEFVSLAHSWMRPIGGTVAMLLRNEWDCAASRTKLVSSLTIKLVLTRRPRWSTTDTASPRHNFAWYIWDFSQNTNPRIIWDQ